MRSATDPRGLAVLEVEGLRAEYRGPGGTVVAADDVSFTVAQRGCVAIVGESGSGKTTIARAIAGLHARLRDGSRSAARSSRRSPANALSSSGARSRLCSRTLLMP